MTSDIEPEIGEEEAGFDILGANQSGMRARNERLVLSLLRRRGAMPKAEIARITGLSAQTVSVIMRALESDGLLERGEKLRGKVGQPSIPMRLAPDGAVFFGLKVGRRTAELVLVNFLGEIQHSAQMTYRYPTPDQTLDFVRRSVRKLASRLGPDTRGRISGLGLAVPFFLWEWASVIGVEEAAMAAWRECDLRAAIQDLFDFPVFMENDATCACGAELVFGEGEALSNFLYMYVGYFIGGGVVLNGHVVTGPSGNAGAIGPLPTDGFGGASRQLVDVASLAGLERRLQAAGGDINLMWERPGAWNIDPSIFGAWLDEAAPAMAYATLSAISVIDFRTVVIDGSMPENLRSRLVERIRSALSTSNFSGLTPPNVISGTLGAKAKSIGAASLPLSKRFMLEA